MASPKLSPPLFVPRFFLIFTFSFLLHAGETETVRPPAPNVVSPDDKLPLFERVLQLNRIQEPELDLDDARRAFSELMDKARSALKDAVTPKEKIAALNKVLLADRNVTYISNKYWRDSTIAASLVRGHGNCLSTATLYMLAGSALNLPIKMVLIPRHAFARWDDGATRINIETTDGGREIPDSEYLSRWSQPSPDDVEKLGWGKTLDDKGVLAELLLAASGHRAGENKQTEALELIDKSLELTPNRTDVLLRRQQILSCIEGRRDEACGNVLEMLNNPKKFLLSPTVQSEALCFLAEQAAGMGRHEAERMLLMEAFTRAPKSQQLHILSSLAFCLRALKDYHGAVRYMELAVALDPRSDSNLYNLAILQKNEGRIKDALKTIAAARELNPESWNLQILQAGYLILDGQHDEGMALYKTLEKPRGDVEFWNIMQAWFFAACKDSEKFYAAFSYALENSTSTRIFEWIDQDPDLDQYRDEEKFKTLVEKHRTRLLAKPKGTQPQP